MVDVYFGAGTVQVEGGESRGVGLVLVGRAEGAVLNDGFDLDLDAVVYDATIEGVSLRVLVEFDLSKYILLG